jgi:hypothetical protein
MKATGVVLGLFLCAFSTFADTTFYGAWYTTAKYVPGTRDSGGATIVLKGDLAAASGVATIYATVNARGTFIQFSGTWRHLGVKSYRVQFGSARPGDNGQLAWRGVFNAARGQLTGSWAGDGARGRFQTRME